MILGVLIGALMGLTGAGGGVLAVPALVWGLGLSLLQAAPVALLGVAIAAMVGTVEGLRRGSVRYRAATLMALAGLPLSTLGSAAAHVLPELALRLLFIAVLLFIGWQQLGPSVRGESEASPVRLGLVAHLDERSGRFLWTRRAGLGFALIGAVTGFLSGLLGVGGGFVLVPLMRHWTPLAASALVSTSLMVIALVSGFGVLWALWHGVGLPLALASPFAGALCAGMLVGRQMAHRLPERWLHRSFGLLVLAVAAGMAVGVVHRLVG